MPDLATRLTKKALLLAKKQTAVGAEATLSEATDAVEVSEPEYTIDPTILERNNVADDLSPFAHVIGRKAATITFKSELKSNGLHAGSTASANVAMLARLIEACGYELTGIDTTAEKVRDPVLDFDNSKLAPAVTWAKAGTPTLTTPVLYTIEVTTGGASAAAQVTITSNDLVADDTTDDVPITVTSGTPFNLGSSGATLTMTWTGNLILGDIYRVLVVPTGLGLKPISENQPVLTIKLWLDGVLHKMTDARGNFTINAEAGQYGTIDFEFQGNFHAVVDDVAPSTPNYEDTLPPQIEYSNLTWGSQRDLVAAAWTFEQGNTLTPRPDVNSNEGVKGVRITSRAPSGGFTPEATTEADHPFWDEIERGKCQTFFAKAGDTPGNIVATFMPKAQINALPYGDRDGIRTYDISFRCTRNVGNDEVEFFFC